jgi:hypothetical protein
LRQEHRQQQLALKHQRIGAYEVHHYEERLKSALAALEEDSTIIPTNKEPFAPTSNTELPRVSTSLARHATSTAFGNFPGF